MEFTTPVYRFKFSQLIMNELEYFAKVHQYDDRKAFKENWETWISEPEIKNMVNHEIQTMKQNGYDGDIIQKMFKSARYYFRNKKDTPAETTEPTNEETPITPNKMKKEKKPRKKYIRLSKELLTNIDIHLLELVENTIQNNSIKNNQTTISMVNISPNYAYNDFNIKHAKDIKMEYDRMGSIPQADNLNTWEDFEQKIKKTYKNRYFVMIRTSSSVILENESDAEMSDNE